MGMGPARQPRSPLAFLSGGWAIFPTLGTVPHNALAGARSLGGGAPPPASTEPPVPGHEKGLKFKQKPWLGEADVPRSCGAESGWSEVCPRIPPPPWPCKERVRVPSACGDG